jgi:excisionase family DNA binding protein
MLFSKKLAAEKLGISEKTLTRKIIDGSISCYKIGRRILFDQNSLDEFLVKCRKPAGGAA